MIKTKKRGNLIVVSGPSGAGKDSICNELVKTSENLWISVSCTSRCPRENEKEGINYYYLTKEEFEQKISANQFLEFAQYNDFYYGTPKYIIEDKLNKGINVILVIEVQGALQIKEIIPDAIFIFIMPPSMDELKTRLTNRGTETEDKLIKRFTTAYKEINEMTKYNYVVVNDIVEEAVRKIQSILIAENCRVDRIEAVDLGNKEELFHETFMK